MSLPGRLAHLEEAFEPERRCPACQSQPRVVVRYENDWREENRLPESPPLREGTTDGGRCPACGGEPIVISVIYSDGWRTPDAVSA